MRNVIGRTTTKQKQDRRSVTHDLIRQGSQRAPRRCTEQCAGEGKGVVHQHDPTCRSKGPDGESSSPVNACREIMKSMAVAEDGRVKTVVVNCQEGARLKEVKKTRK